MFPTFISILDIQSWWEVPSIAHFCSLFRTAFNLLDFDIEDLEEALLTDGTEESSWLQELIVRLLSGCLPSNEISTFNYQMFLRRLFRQKCQENGGAHNPFNTDVDFQLLPLRTKVDILRALCDFRLDGEDVLDRLKNLEADSLRVEPLGYDGNDSAYWYFYGTRLYREDYKSKLKKEDSVWQVICFTQEDWFQLAKKFKKSTNKAEKQLYCTLTENFLPELPRLFQEKEKLARKKLLEKPRKSSRLQKLENEALEERRKAEEKQREKEKEREAKEKEEKRKLIEKKRREAYERRTKQRQQSEDSQSEHEVWNEMADANARKKKTTNSRHRRNSSSSSSHDQSSSHQKPPSSSVSTTVGRQTNNSLASATGQIVIQSVTNPHRKKLKTSQVFRQTEEDLQTGMHKILDYVKNDDDAWPFVDPVEEEYAPNYYSIIRKPMDLQKMEERLDSGYYKTFSKFRADFQLIVDNCRLYNGVENEYTLMVDNLSKAFEKATERYLDQISSSDDEIAVEYPESESDSRAALKKKKTETPSKRKPTLAAQTDKKRERSVSEEESIGRTSDSLGSCDKKVPRKSAKVENKVSVNKKKKNNDVKKAKKRISPVRSRSPSMDKWSSSPPPSWPPSSPESDHGQKKKAHNNSIYSSEDDTIIKSKDKPKLQEKQESEKPKSENRIPKKQKEVEKPVLQFEHKDKHNKLRETIEKLKAKSEISSKLKEKDFALFDGDKKTKSKEDLVEKRKEKQKMDLDYDEGSTTADSTKSDKNCNKKKPVNSKVAINKNVEIEALTLATEQTLKDINKWLDDTPRFSEFSSASNSPSHYISIDEFDPIGGKPDEARKKNEKPPAPKKEGAKDKKKSFHRDPMKFLKKREIQRTIDRLQPGKSKGNLLSTVQNTKQDEIFPLGPLSKIKDTKNSLIVKTDDNTPKLSLGSVLDSFGKHKFNDDQKKEEKENKEIEKLEEEAKELKPEVKPTWDANSGQTATPNLSAWFKAFGVPKKKGEGKAETKTEEVKGNSVEQKKKTLVAPAEPSPNPESPAAQPVARQRKISTGSSMSERSSFSQDMDSPRVGIDERLGTAYPAPYPSPLHRSPASPVTASPRPDVSPKAYPTFNGQIRVGFYQDTVSTKSSPDKSSCSPRDNNPYNQYPPSYGNPYCSHPSYSGASPTPPYNSEGSPAMYDGKTGGYPAGRGYEGSEGSSPASQRHSPTMEIVQQTIDNKLEKQAQGALYPVKKRAYNEADPPHINRYDLQPSQDYSNMEMNLSVGRQANMAPIIDETNNKQYMQQAKQTQQETSPVMQQQVQQEIESREENVSFSTAANIAYNSSYVADTYPLNIPVSRGAEHRELDGKIDMLKYTNMGYTGSDLAFARNATQFTGFSRSSAVEQQQQQQANSSGDLNMGIRYSSTPGMSIGYKDMNTAANVQQTNHLTSLTGPSSHQATRPGDASNYGNSSMAMQQSLDLRGNLGNISHIVDRFSTDERALSSSYYGDKSLGGANMFSKPSSTSTANLPIFSQPNVALSYGQEMQVTASAMYNRQISELQNVANVDKTSILQSDKKSKRRKSAKVATTAPAGEPATNSANQGFQSYAGLKGNPSMEPGAISLKTASVVPGSAFNFGPSPTGIGLGTGLYGDKEGYSNFLDEFRGAPNYYMAAAAVHHRSTSDSPEKRPAHQTTPQPPPPTSGYPFLGGPQARPPAYPLGSPFMSAAHQALPMDPTSPLYQQYMLHHQGLLGGPTGYPPGYHPAAAALGMRQTYEQMTRPSWL